MQKPKKPDVIVSWPDNCDYPLWRQFVRDNRFRFNKVIIAFTRTNQTPDYSEFVIRAMADDDCIFFNAPYPSNGADWRDLAVNKALQFVESDWVWFTEQDFYVKGRFWDEVEKSMNGADVITIHQGDRMHPCCLFVKKEMIEKTRKNFGIVPNKLDHFGLFSEDLRRNQAVIDEMLADCYFHYNGLSSNFTLLTNGQMPNYEPEQFARYLYECLTVSVPLDPNFKRMVESALRVEFAGITQGLR